MLIKKVGSFRARYSRSLAALPLIVACGAGTMAKPVKQPAPTPSATSSAMMKPAASAQLLASVQPAVSAAPSAEPVKSRPVTASEPAETELTPTEQRIAEAAYVPELVCPDLEGPSKITASIAGFGVARRYSRDIPVNVMIRINGLPKGTKSFSVYFITELTNTNSEERSWPQDVVLWKGPGTYKVRGHVWSGYYDQDDEVEAKRPIVKIAVQIMAHSEVSTLVTDGAYEMAESIDEKGCLLSDQTITWSITKTQYRSLVVGFEAINRAKAAADAAAAAKPPKEESHYE